MKPMTMTLVVCCLALAAGCDENGDIVNPPDAFVLTFEDEFEGAAGDLPDLSIWQFDLGTGPNGDGWGNQEQQFYTGRPENASLDGEGNLRIIALEEEFAASDYTSARIRTEDNFEQAYGRFEARIQLPPGQGIWPAFWMLGGDFAEVGWPPAGEIDIMEYRGQQPDRVVGSIHGPGYFAGEALSDVFVDDEGTFDDGFHTFAIEWDPGRIAWFVDGELFHQRTSGAVNGLVPLPGSTAPTWVFNKPFFMILNLAVGGSFVGDPDDTTPFPATMLVDYVRVFSRPNQL